MTIQYDLPEFLGVYYDSDNVPRLNYATSGSACFDLAYFIEGDSLITYYSDYGSDYDNKDKKYFVAPMHDYSFEIKPGNVYMIPTGLRFDIPTGFSLRIFSRSSTPLKYGLELANSVGVIDSDYVHHLYLLMRAHRYGIIQNKTRLCQAELIKTQPHCWFNQLSKPPELKGDRSGGLGSTGT